jgi:curli biogenesis system outer membrane secretion channel CsgG
MRALASTLVLASALLAAACTGAKVVRGEGQTIEQARAENALGSKFRIAVGHIVDKTDPSKEQSIPRQLAIVNAKRKPDEQLSGSGITSGIHDLLVTELFNTGQFIVLERDALNDVMVEQEFSASARVGDATRIPSGELEGAELLVIGAITSFDAGLEGAAIPIPVPFGKFSNGFGIISLSMKRGYVAMDLRIIDTATGRIVASTAVEGRNTSYGANFEGLYSGHTGYLPLPGLLNAFSNTPVEQALQKMVIVAIGTIAAQKPSKLPPPGVAAEAVAPPAAARASSVTPPPAAAPPTSPSPAKVPANSKAAPPAASPPPAK